MHLQILLIKKSTFMTTEDTEKIMICFPFRAEMGNAASKTSYGACL